MLWLHLYGNTDVALTLFTSHALAASTWRIIVGSFFSLRFVAKQYILQQKCLKEVNSKLAARNTTVQLLTPYTEPECRL